MSNKHHGFTESTGPGTSPTDSKRPVAAPARLDPRAAGKGPPTEVGGYQGPEPTRFGDWEHKGRCTDF